MRRLAILLAGAALLAGCAAPAVPEAASAVQAVSSEAGTGHAGSRTEQLAVLDGLVDFGADTGRLQPENGPGRGGAGGVPERVGV